MPVLAAATRQHFLRISKQVPMMKPEIHMLGITGKTHKNVACLVRKSPSNRKPILFVVNQFIAFGIASPDKFTHSQGNFLHVRFEFAEKSSEILIIFKGHISTQLGLDISNNVLTVFQLRIVAMPSLRSMIAFVNFALPKPPA